MDNFLYGVGGEWWKMDNLKIYKDNWLNYFSSLRIVSMIPGDREVARCFYFWNCEKLINSICLIK